MPIYEPIVPGESWPESLTFSPGVRSGNLVFLSGTTGIDERGRIVGIGDIVEQTRQIFRKFAAVIIPTNPSLTPLPRLGRGPE